MTSVDVFECFEHGEVGIPVERLLVDGEIVIDDRVAKRGYFHFAISDGKLQLRSTRFVGLIPINGSVAVRIKPKVTIANLSQMIVKCGNIPAVVENFSRGYRPLFIQSDKTIEIYYKSHLSSVSRIATRGLMKSYVRDEFPPKWRGRLLVSETIQRFIAKGIRYDGVFDYRTLSYDIPENQAIKASLSVVANWLEKQLRRDELAEATSLMRLFSTVQRQLIPTRQLVSEIPKMARSLPPHLHYYREPLWTAYAILQGSMPDVSHEGFVSLDSMIVDISTVFEHFTRKVLTERAREVGLQIKDGNIHQKPFFEDGDNIYKVKPDMIVERDDSVLAILEVKYKPTIQEQDRYQLLASMEATSATHAAFICPAMSETESSGFLGRTPSGKNMGVIRVDLSNENLSVEEDKLFKNVFHLTNGDYAFMH